MSRIEELIFRGLGAMLLATFFGWTVLGFLSVIAALKVFFS